MEKSDLKIQEMQMIEQNLQNILLQKQAFQMELTETQSAMKEIKDSSDEVYKIIGQLMVKVDKSKMQEELLNKEKLLELRVKSVDKQEENLTKQLEKLREEIMKSVKK